MHTDPSLQDAGGYGRKMSCACVCVSAIAIVYQRYALRDISRAECRMADAQCTQIAKLLFAFDGWINRRKLLMNTVSESGMF